MESDGLPDKCHETMILLQAIYFWYFTERFYAISLE